MSARDGSLTRNWLGVAWMERPWFAEMLACAVAALAYMATLSFGFVYDDVPQILKNPAVHAWRSVPQYFTAHVWAAIYPNTPGNYYRPIFLLWLRLNYALFGAEPAGWHLTSVACHVLATWLVFRVVRQLTTDRTTAFVAALLFGLHPAHIENVAWISGVTDPLMACFVLGSLSAFLSYRDCGGILIAAGALALFALALLSKETAIVAPVLMLGCALTAGPGEGAWPGSKRRINGTPGMRAVAVLAPTAAISLVYLAVRFFALGGLSHSTVSIGWRETFLSWPSVSWFYLKHLAGLAPLTEFYALDYVSAFSTGTVLAPLGLVVISGIVMAGLVLAIRERTEKNLALLALVMIAMPLLPVLDLRSLTAGDVVHDRYLYLPSVGLALFMALLVRELAPRLSPSGAKAVSQSTLHPGTTNVVPFPVSFKGSLPHDARSRVGPQLGQTNGEDLPIAPALTQPGRIRMLLPAMIVVGISVAFAVLTVSQEMQWASDILLYARGLESAPDNLTVRDNLANALMDANQPGRAIPLYLEVLRRNPRFWRSNYNLGYAYYKAGNFAGAEEYLKRAIQIDPGDSDEYIYLALTQLQLTKLREAGESARLAISLNPHARGYHSIAGLIYDRQGDLTRAAEEFKAEIAEHPDNAAAVTALRKLQEPKPAR